MRRNTLRYCALRGLGGDGTRLGHLLPRRGEGQGIIPVQHVGFLVENVNSQCVGRVLGEGASVTGSPGSPRGAKRTPAAR
jgi:hypothetical protein